ncbi:MAG: hypothetical protein AAFP04_12520 [Myxococcota bacterium]
MAKLGTLRWMRETHGKLGLLDRLRMIAQGVRARAALRRSSGQRYVGLSRNVDEILPPDGAVARAALAMCEADSPRFLFLHSMRSYFWARLLDDGSVRYDDEALFAAVMLHDMGLTNAHRLVGETEHCFTVVGAQMVRDLALKHHWDERRADLAAEAITLHLNVIVDSRDGQEAKMLRAGSGADVAGLGVDGLCREHVRSVCSRFPRENLSADVTRVLAREAQERPRGRLAFLNRSLGFLDLIRGTEAFKD